jgi:NOL1/NOP2/fmu family ribosome biogenesis protein
MDKITLMNKKEYTTFADKINSTYGSSFNPANYSFYINSKGKVYIINTKATTIDYSKLRVNAMGLYFADMSGYEIRLSIEGAIIIGKSATKNIVQISDEDAKLWMQGLDLDIKAETKSYVLIKNNNDIFGSGKSTGEKIINYMPKIRRLI